MISRSPKGEEDCGQASDDLAFVRARALVAGPQVKTTWKNE
ncbi:hypothetical protein ACQU0X_32080 [Pseudovibrio ascidiaceicola]